jgi:GNAT superfamily N-acetyltransferase
LTKIRPIADADRRRFREVVTADWGSTSMATRGRLVDVAEAPGFVALDGDDWLGYSAYEIHGQAMEIVAIESHAAGQGIGAALLAACVAVARDANLQRLWLITTNDNIDALRFYQRRGFVLVAVHRDAVTDARRDLKPEIGATGAHGIPIRDEIELELPPAVWNDFIERYSWPS